MRRFETQNVIECEKMEKMENNQKKKQKNIGEKEKKIQK